jgi:hypothetical protein
MICTDSGANHAKANRTTTATVTVTARMRNMRPSIAQQETGNE